MREISYDHDWHRKFNWYENDKQWYRGDKLTFDHLVANAAVTIDVSENAYMCVRLAEYRICSRKYLGA